MRTWYQYHTAIAEPYCSLEKPSWIAFECCWLCLFGVVCVMMNIVDYKCLAAVSKTWAAQNFSFFVCFGMLFVVPTAMLFGCHMLISNCEVEHCHAVVSFCWISVWIDCMKLHEYAQEFCLNVYWFIASLPWLVVLFMMLLLVEFVYCFCAMPSHAAKTMLLFEIP